MVANAEDGARLTANVDRPDIIAVYWDPVVSRPNVEMYEIPSGEQGVAGLVAKMQAAMNTLPEHYRTTITPAENVIPRDQ